MTSTTTAVRPTVTVSGQDIEASPGATILETLLRAGIWVPNSCNQGTCGTCKVRVLSGRVEHLTAPSDALTSTERSAGLALACQSNPLCDTVVEPATAAEDTAARVVHPLRDLTATVEGVEDIARDTRRVLLRLSEPLAFHAGQYIEVTVPGTTARRQYSLANVSSEDEVLELHVKRVAGGVASEAWVFGSIAVGEDVAVSGPYGDFHLPHVDADDGGPMVLIGGGTGLAPLIGIVREALSRHPERQVLLYHGVRTTADLYDSDRLRDLESVYPGFRVIAVTSREPATGTKRSGYAQDAFCADVNGARGWSGWLCGPPRMVESGIRAFKRRRMAPRLIHRETFTAATR